MVRSLVYILAALIAVAFGSDQADQPVLAAASVTQASVRLTPAETDCIVGGQADCGAVVRTSFEDCMTDIGASPENPQAYNSAAGMCGTYAGIMGIVCALEWLWNLIF